jgi:hypothetical protein
MNTRFNSERDTYIQNILLLIIFEIQEIFGNRLMPSYVGIGLIEIFTKFLSFIFGLVRTCDSKRSKIIISLLHLAPNH